MARCGAWMTPNARNASVKRRNRLRITADDEGTTFNGSVECYTAIVSKLAPIRGPAFSGRR
ncbi:hypothetical protein D3C72_2507850 [compost metagenome]